MKNPKKWPIIQYIWPQTKKINLLDFQIHRYIDIFMSLREREREGEKERSRVRARERKKEKEKKKRERENKSAGDYF